MMGNPLEADLESVLRWTRPHWEELHGGRIFVTGGTGFFGCWLTETFLWINERLALDAEMVVLTRDPAAFMKKAPHLGASPAIQLHRGDVKNFEFPAGKFSHVIHAATETSGPAAAEDHAATLATTVEGTKRALEFSKQCGAKKFLLTSSGAVYGKQPAELTHVTEDYSGAPDVSQPRSAYGEGKRMSELLCAIHGPGMGVETKIARCFAFVGPYLPVDAHFAIGNFIRDAIKESPIQISGDGTPFRSYLYAADLAAWLWTILFKGKPNRPYNVGSSQALNIEETAHAVARSLNKKIPIHIASKPLPSALPQRYVPNIHRATSELQLDQWTQLDDAIRKTAAWHLRSK